MNIIEMKKMSKKQHSKKRKERKHKHKWFKSGIYDGKQLKRCLTCPKTKEVDLSY